MLNTDRLCLGCMNDCGGEKVCAICGYDSATRNPSDCLPTKLWLNDRYLVGKVLERDCGCISYIGWDNADDSIVTIREYFPLDIARRNPDKTVSVSEEGKYLYNGGLMSFLETNTCTAGSSRYRRGNGQQKGARCPSGSWQPFLPSEHSSEGTS